MFSSILKSSITSIRPPADSDGLYHTLLDTKKSNALLTWLLWVESNL